MRSKLALSALVLASLFGATLTASAQTQPAPGASSEGNVGPGATKSGMKGKDGMTTGAGMNQLAHGSGDSPCGPRAAPRHPQGGMHEVRCSSEIRMSALDPARARLLAGSVGASDS